MRDTHTRQKQQLLLVCMRMWLCVEEEINQRFSFLSLCFLSKYTCLHTGICITITFFNTENPKQWVEKTVSVHFSAEFVSKKNKDSCETIPNKACFMLFTWYLWNTAELSILYISPVELVITAETTLDV